jgi:hypothetical protein
MHGPDAPTRATRGPGTPARATCGPDVFVHATRGLGFTLHRAPPSVQATTSGPLASGHQSTTPSPWLVTPAAPTRWSPVVLPRSPSPLIVYNIPPSPLPRHCLRSRPLSAARSRTPTSVTLWRSTRSCCLTTRGTWFLSLLRLMSSPISGSSSASLRRMTLLISTRLVGSPGLHSAPRGGLR